MDHECLENIYFPNILYKLCMILDIVKILGKKIY